MYKLIKTMLVGGLITINTLLMGGSTNISLNNIPTIEEIEVTKGYREQLLSETFKDEIEITKSKSKKVDKKEKEVFVEVTEESKPVKDEIKETDNVRDENNHKDDNEKVNETIETEVLVASNEVAKEEEIEVYANETVYVEVKDEVYANETEYEEHKKVYANEVEFKNEVFADSVPEGSGIIEPIVEEEPIEIEEEAIENEEEAIEEEVIEEEVTEIEEEIVIDEPVEPNYTGSFRDYIMAFYGGSYVWGGGSPSTGFDCSGLVQYAYQNFFGIWLPRTAAEQANTGYEVGKDNLIEGDLVVFQNSYSSYPDHIGMYVGQGEYIHASSPERGITTDSIYGSYFIGNCVSVRRHIGEPISVVEEPIIEEEVVISEEPIIEEEIVEEDNSYSLTMEATAYTHTGNPTATGVYPTAYHTVSVDPNVIPLGTRMYIEGYGYAVAEDTGGAIKGHILDLFFDTYEECVEWGYRTVNVTILD